ALTVAEKLRDLVRKHPFFPSSQESGEALRPLTVSVGVSSYPEDGQSTEELVDAADIALYEAKGSGRDRVVVSEKHLPAAQVSA
ncbi:MAG: diguanylate cyclase, partial [Deltaproteobacteria bacterium]|nr:diguanylate cyclase [Deltaproteobacteria bacterium]